MLCANCGAVHARSDQFCRYCGWHLGDEQPSQPLNQSNQPLVIAPPRALVPIDTKQALALGSAATVAAGTLMWLAARWVARKALPALVSKLPALLTKPAKPTAASLPSAATPQEAQVEVYYYARHIRVRR